MCCVCVCVEVYWWMVLWSGVTAGTVTAGGKAVNHAQLQFYKQQQLLRQQQQRLIRDHQLKVLQAQSASNQKVSVAVTAGTTMGIATVAGVTAVQVSQAQQQRAQVMVLADLLTASSWQPFRMVSSAMLATALEVKWMNPLHPVSSVKVKGKAIPLQAWTSPEGSRRLRFPDFKTFGTWRWQGCQPYALAAFTPRKYSRYSFLLEAESTPGP